MDKKMFDWLTRELEERGWSQRELARRADINYTTVSKVMSGQARVTFNFCAAISKPLDRQPIDIFRIAGLLPPSAGMANELSQDESEWLEIYRSLDSSRRKLIFGVVASWRDGLKKQS